MAELVDDAGRPAPAWARPGTVVRYRPHVGHDPWYLGQITSEPRLLGGTWVVRVGRMEAAYRNVAAAALDALEPVAELAGRVAELEAHVARVAGLPSMDEARASAAIMQVAATLARRGDTGLAHTLRDAVDRWRAHAAQERRAACIALDDAAEVES